VVVGYIIWLLSGKTKNESVVEETAEKVNIWEESKHWVVLFEHVWPVLTISLMLGIVDATFWTTGTVLSDNLAKSSWLGGMFLPLYMLPMIFMGVIVAKWGVYKGKKKIAEIFMLLAGILLSLVGWRGELWFLLLIAFGVGAAMAVSWPLTDAVYSDIVSRMGREGKHMMGLSSSTISLAYVIGPILVGYVASQVGEVRTFGFAGMAMALVALVLLFVTPKKLRLPQEEIKKWE
jgi:MFS family permease